MAGTVLDIFYKFNSFNPHKQHYEVLIIIPIFHSRKPWHMEVKLVELGLKIGNLAPEYS